MNLRFWTLDFYKELGYGLGSSEYLAKRLVTLAHLDREDLIVELGAWEWQVTRHIIQAKWAQTRFISIENDPERSKLLQKEFKEWCELHEMSAAHIDNIVAEWSADIVISTLPLGSISDEGVESILKAIKKILKPGGTYIQYQYWMYNRWDIKRHFTIEKTYWEPRNIVPTFIYVAKKQ